jgi:hypothetical protein
MKSRESKRKSSESNNDKKTKDVKRSKTEVKTDKVSGNNQRADSKSKKCSFYSDSCFMTINNYTQKSKDYLDKCLTMKSVKWMACQEETGKEGTPHIQGTIKWHKARNLNDLNGDLMDPGTYVKIISETGGPNYCVKNDETRTVGGNRWIKGMDMDDEGKLVKHVTGNELAEKLWEEEMEEDYKDVQWKTWQQKCIDVVEGKVDPRKVYWFWESHGNVGKSFISDYLAWKYDALVVNGNYDNSMHCVVGKMENMTKMFPVVVDVPKSQANHLSYKFLEAMKARCKSSMKYESKEIKLPRAHVIVFANRPPDTEKLSQDRWCVQEIGSISL